MVADGTEGMEALPASLARMAGLLVSEQTLDAVLELIVSLVHTTVPDVTGASVSLATGNSVRTASFTDETVRDLDLVQYDTNEGPCVEAIRTGHAVEVRLGADPSQWPTFTAAALGLGMQTILSTPLTVKETVLGALNSYSATPDAFDDAQRNAARLFAQQASVLLANTLAYGTAARMNDELREALATREMIGQAKGIIMAQRRCTRDEAFDILRRASQRTNRKLRDIATELVESIEQGPSSDD